MVRLSEKNDTFMEIYRPEDGRPDGSPRQLWSASGFLSMVYHGLMGIHFEQAGVRFAPVVPERFRAVALSNFKYRGATLQMAVKGHGTTIDKFLLDGQEQKDPFFSAASRGEHTIEIRMK